MKKSIIVAIAQNDVIGKNNSLPWHLPEDLKRFKELTTGHYVIMGRKTYESIGKPLKNRTNVIVSNTLSQNNCDKIFIEKSLTDAIEYAEEDALNTCCENSEIFIIGGVSLFNEAIDIVDTIYLTRILADYDGDVFWTFDLNNWEITSSDYKENNNIKYCFQQLKRK